jgi:hypothetical protein
MAKSITLVLAVWEPWTSARGISTVYIAVLHTLIDKKLETTNFNAKKPTKSSLVK